ncbi:MAG TPA: FmdB family zinc ribbon protein [Burkholderiales bacterium]|nr:FmdB family zinc ribbon protein [Burkholderiales bacterium]
MPIYEYRCSACGFQKDFLQRLNEAPHTKCPECGKRTFTKQVTAAGFQLKGTGWYATDFKNSGAKPKEKAKDGGAEGPAKEAPAKESSTKETATKESSTKESSTKESSKQGSKSGAGASQAGN